MVIETPVLSATEHEYGVGLESARCVTAAISRIRLPRIEGERPSLEEIQFTIKGELPEQFHYLIDISWDYSVGLSYDEWEEFKSLEFGQSMRRFREKVGLTVDQVAEKSEFIRTGNGNAVCCIESDVIVPKGETFVDLVEVLGLDVRDKTAHLLLLKSLQSSTTVSL